MARRLSAARLIVASHNAGKVREIAALLDPLGIEALGASALGLAEPEETGDTFIANAVLKARAAAVASGEPALTVARSTRVVCGPRSSRNGKDMGVSVLSDAKVRRSLLRPPSGSNAAPDILSNRSCHSRWTSKAILQK